jgi:cysteine-rich repeat protein
VSFGVLVWGDFLFWGVAFSHKKNVFSIFFLSCSSTCGVEPGWSCSVPEPALASRCWHDRKGLASAPAACGNSVVERDPDSAHAYETCDDGNTVSGDGCSSTCRVEYGYRCVTNAGTGVPTTCTALPDTSCEHVYRRDALTGDGARSGLGISSNAVSTWCVASGDGGAFSMVLHMGSGSPSKYVPDSFAELGDVATTPLSGTNVNKLRDDKIVSLQAPAPHRSEWRLTSSWDPGSAWYFRLRGTFTDESPGLGLTPYEPGLGSTAVTATFEFCRSSTGIADCTASDLWFLHHLQNPDIVPFDVLKADPHHNDCTRIFFDHNTATCFDMGTSAERCFSAGTACSGGHPRITGFTTSVRPMCARCGDGCTDPTLGEFESCDDGNTDESDGCSATCQVEPGWICSAHTELRSRCLRLSDQVVNQESGGMVSPLAAAAARLQSCLDVKRLGYPSEAGSGAAVSGIYPIFPVSAGGTVRTVYCDMTTDSDAGGYGAEAGGWARMATFATVGDTQGALDDETRDRFFRFALWTDGASHGLPVHPDPSQQTVGKELKVWCDVFFFFV